MSVGDSIAGFFDRMRPGPRVPAARRRAIKSEALSSPASSIGGSKLQEEHDRLAREFVVLQWDLGGIAYEMARRDHFRTEVIAQQAAKLQQVDSSLGQAERMLRLEHDGVASSCSSCGAMQARGAVYCWQCGIELISTASVTTPAPTVPPPAPPSAPPPNAQAPPPAPEPSVAEAPMVATQQVPG